MNILFLYISLPHLSQNGVFVDLIKEFDKQGHNVKVVTPARKGDSVGLSKEAGIDVIRFKTDQLTNNTSNIQKGIAYIKLIYQFPKAVFDFFRKVKFDLIIAISIPTEMGLIIKRLKKYYNAKAYLMLCEYIWQDSVSLGFFKEKSIICRYYKWLEAFMIRTVDFIGSPSQGNINFTLHYYPWAVEKNIHILHYSKFPVQIKLAYNTIRQKYNLNNNFVAIYGGNMSIAQKAENIINLAEACQEYKDIIFLLLGRGQEVDFCKNEAKIRGVTNIIFIDFLPREEYYELLSVCDVGLISLNEKLAIPNIPSKTLDYFNLGVPVVASIDRVTDYGQYLEQAEAGLWSYAGDITSFKENLLKLYNSPELRKRMSEKGMEFYNKYMIPAYGYQTIIEHISL
ncbi:MAG: glycosyltransferase family 4 protein [Clostridiales bacterium]|jgi:glycosyltransferase involved in cell wall biosynthesis|nr:glycosyltransferase family 4 protein [Clostridiales bacterium]